MPAGDLHRHFFLSRFRVAGAVPAKKIHDELENMKHNRIGRISFLAALLAGSSCAQAEVRVPEIPAAVFPLPNHSSWIYSGTARLDHNPEAGPLTIRMDVIETITRGDIQAAWVKGSPTGLNNNFSGGHVIAMVGNRFYIVEPPRTGDVLQRLRDSDDKLANLFLEPEMIFTVPLAVGNSTKIWKVAAEKPGTPAAEFEITSTGRSGYQTIRFVPGLGITGFAFEDKPSRQFADVHLVDHDARPE